MQRIVLGAGFTRSRWWHGLWGVRWLRRERNKVRQCKRPRGNQHADSLLLPSALPRMSSPGHKWTDFLSFTLSFAGEPGEPGPDVTTCSRTENLIRKTPWERVTEKPLLLVRSSYGEDGNKANTFRPKAGLLWTLQRRKIALIFFKFWLDSVLLIGFGEAQAYHNAHVEVREGRGSLLQPCRAQG